MIAMRHAYAERGDDVYETPREAIEALLRVEDLPKMIWEPACGPGAIVGVLRERGHLVFASDLVDYKCPDAQAGVDFLMEMPRPNVQAIVTNPPYRLAPAFVRHALDMAVPKVCMLLRLAFLEGLNRTPILDNGKLARVHVFRNRLPMMHRRNWRGPQATSSIAFAWFVWEAAHNDAPRLHRITWW